MEQNSDIEITFVGTQRGIESRVIPREGLNLKVIPAGGLVGKQGLERWNSWFKLPAGLAKSLYFLISKRPNLVVGVGGYASGPLVLSAGMLKIPILIHEQNAIPGITNRWLGKIADKIAVSFKQSIRYFPKNKVVETGNMIRQEFCQEAYPDLPKGNKFCVLVFGGSQGAQSINEAVLAALDHLNPYRDRLHFIHQTGESDSASTQKQYTDKGFSSEVQPFFFNMAEQYRRASLIICRAGATTLAEVTASGKASILVPFPYAAHDHQVKNAEVLKAEDAAEIIYDHQLNGELLGAFIQNGLEHPEYLQTLGGNSFRLGNRKATQKVAQLCMELMRAGRSETLKSGAS